VFYGAATVVVGYLIHRSGFVPGFIGVLLIIGGLCQVANTFALILAPAYAFFWQMIPLLLAMLTLAFWFLVRAIDVGKWTAMAGRIRTAA
jgi:hypothetical protein